jgi:signal transduction histidine kinase
MKKYSLSILIIFFTSLAFTQNIIFHNQNKTIFIGNQIKIYTDSSNLLDPAQILNSTNFKKSNEFAPNLGVSNNTHWIRFELTNTNESEKLLLNIAQPQIDSAVLFEFDQNNVLQNVSKLGDAIKFTQRKFEFPDLIFELNISTGETKKYLIKLNSGQQITLATSIGTPNSILKNLETKDILFGIYCGIILAMFFYNIFLFFSLNDRFYFLYVVYILSVGTLQACLEGYTFKYLWPNNPWLANQSVTWLSAISASLAMLFFRYFLQTKKYAPLLNKGLNVFIFIYVLAIVLSITGYYTISYNIILLNAMIVALYLFGIAIYILRQGYKPAKFFIIAWSTFLSGICVYVLKDFEILPYNLITNYTMQIGSALEVIFLSFALADRINILKREKELSQAEALKISKENERLVTNQKIMLEKEVAERTADLETAYRDLQETQSQLVNSEKMASLGQLTAGVAHEINNPINFVVSNINPLRRDINDIKELLSKYDTLKNDDTYDFRLGEIENFKKEIDYNYVQEEIEILLKGISEGATRTSEIVKSLKNFSRLDEHDLKKTNINEGISSSIVLLSQQIDTIKVIQNLGLIPEIECFPGKINQAFMNILTNAIEAIHTHRKEGGILEITTYQQDKYVVATIKDNGTGMPEEVKNKIFEPFYTTKDVGKGTGLGLSITHGIIEKHNGTISIQSEIGMGTMFEIKLPIQAPTTK